MARKALFCIPSRGFVAIFLAPLTPSGVCHTAHLYESTGLTTAKYTLRALLNEAPHVEAARRIRDISCAHRDTGSI